jgi:fumarylpyruvate hydrolase
MNEKDYVIAPARIAAVPVLGGGFFPVRRIFCVGRNYADHVREMGGDPAREKPVFFTKPADAVVIAGADTPYPPMTRDYHHEVELVVAIGLGGAGIAEETAQNHVFGYACGLDMTRRDLQAAARKAGMPWDMAKAFDASAPIGAIAPAATVGHVAKGRISLRVNGMTRQDADLAQMILPVPAIIAELSALVTLAPGDLIFTGTPDGVGPVMRGDVLEGAIAGLPTLTTRII